MSESWRHILAGISLLIMVLVEWHCCVGLLRAEKTYSALHFLGPAVWVGCPLIVLAMILEGSPFHAVVKGITLAVILIVTSPVSGHVIARAARIREHGHAESTPAEIKTGKTRIVMEEIFQTAVLLLVAAGGTMVVLTRNPQRQALMLSVYGMLLTILFMALQAPDVALSELAVGTAAVPLMLLITLAMLSASVAKGHSSKKKGTGS